MQSSGYSKESKRIVSVYVDGSTVVEIEEEPQKAKRVKTIEQQRREGLKAAQEQKILNAKRNLKIALGCVGCAAVVAVMALLLTSAITYNTLTSEVDSLTAQLEELTLTNDSLEYDIDSSVDLSYIIDTATGELGMVKSTSSQIVTYSDAESEYVDQVAGIPTN